MKHQVEFSVLVDSGRFYVVEKIRSTDPTTGEITEIERKISGHYYDQAEARRLANLLNSDRPSRHDLF